MEHVSPEYQWKLDNLAKTLCEGFEKKETIPNCDLYDYTGSLAIWYEHGYTAEYMAYIRRGKEFRPDGKIS